MLDQPERMAPGHIRVGHALEDVNGGMRADHAAKQQMPAPVLNQPTGDRRGFGRIVRRPSPDAFFHEFGACGGVELRPHQLFGEIHRRREQDQTGETRQRADGGEMTRQQQRQPAAHRTADQNLRPLRRGLKNRDALGQPVANAAVDKSPFRRAMAGIIEPQAGASLRLRPFGEKLRLGPAHVRREAAEPDQTGPGVRPRRRRQTPGDPPGRSAGRIGNCEKVRRGVVDHVGDLLKTAISLIVNKPKCRMLRARGLTCSLRTLR